MATDFKPKEATVTQVYRTRDLHSAWMICKKVKSHGIRAMALADLDSCHCLVYVAEEDAKKAEEFIKGLVK